MPTIPRDVAFALAALTAFIANWIRGDGLPARFNAIMAAASFLILTALCMWLIHGFSGSLRDNALYFIALAIALGANELIGLIRIAYQVRSPLAKKS